MSVPARAGGAPRVKVGAVLARNTLWNYAGFAINMATSFVLFPFVVGHLGEAAAGVWLLLGAVTGYMGLMELGIVPALTQRVAAAHGRGDHAAVQPPAAPSGSTTLSTILFGSTGPRGGRRDGLVDAAAKSTARAIGSSLGRAIMRGALGSLLGGGRRR